MIIFNGDVIVLGAKSGTERLVNPDYVEAFLRSAIDPEDRKKEVVTGWGNYVVYKEGKLIALYKLVDANTHHSEEFQLLLTNEHAVDFLKFLRSKYQEKRNVLSDFLLKIDDDLSGLESDKGEEETK